MADDGGSTGVLRYEFGVLPPGDVRQCLVALAQDDTVMRELFSYRYQNGGLAGHNFGNLFLSTLEKITGSLDKAIELASRVLNISGTVVPVTLTDTNVVAELNNGKILTGESQLREYQLLSRFGIKKLYLKPKAKANPRALKAIREADFIIIGPGNFYGSLAPNFLVDGIGPAIARSKARKIYIANIMNKYGHTDGFNVMDCARALEKMIGKKNLFDYIIYNTKTPPRKLVYAYADEGSVIDTSREQFPKTVAAVGADVLANGIAKVSKVDMLQRTLIRHDPQKLAKALMTIIG
jgi:uncharacterized cofD-like protein